MHQLSIFKEKLLIFQFISFGFFVVTGQFLFAMDGVQEQNESENKVKHSFGETRWVPVVVLDDGKDKQIVSFNEFFKLVSKSSAENPNEVSASQLAEIMKLQNQIETGKKQIEMVNKQIESLVKMTHQMGNKYAKDSWWKEGVKNGFKFYKDKLIVLGKYLAEEIVHFTIAGMLILGTAWVVYKVFWTPVYCQSPMPDIFWVLSNLPKVGSKIPESWYAQNGVCSGYYPDLVGKDGLLDQSQMVDNLKPGSLKPECYNLPDGSIVPWDCIVK